MRPRSVIASLAALLVAAFAAAQDEGHDHAAEPAGTFGRVHFPISCNAEAQEQVEHGVALLHSF
ncbi:MAG TPA: hypothetical protein VEG84_08540, partial [Thermoanaerobaculia bacterium]|nr:hypothetical protein [Thermoanaerobaculia bacterium]